MKNVLKKNLRCALLSLGLFGLDLSHLMAVDSTLIVPSTTAQELGDLSHIKRVMVRGFKKADFLPA